MINVNHITKSYGDFVAVNDISFEIAPGHIYGFLGPNGAGKSTTLNIIAGCLAADSGTVDISCHDIYSDPVNAKKKIGFLPEIPPLYKDMTPFEYLNFIAEAKGVPFSDIDEHIKKVMHDTGIELVSNRLISTLSKGYCQRVGIASAMISYPETIILDEPTVGLDPSQIKEIRELIKEHTIVFSSHILSEVSALCDTIIIINNGRILEIDTADNIMKKYNDSYIYKISLPSVTDAEKASELLRDNDFIYSVEKEECILKIEVSPEYENDGSLISLLVSNGIPVLEFSRNEKSLEEIFISLTSSDEYFDDEEDYSLMFSDDNETDNEEDLDNEDDL